MKMCDVPRGTMWEGTRGMRALLAGTPSCTSCASVNRFERYTWALLCMGTACTILACPKTHDNEILILPIQPPAAAESLWHAMQACSGTKGTDSAFASVKWFAGELQRADRF